MLQHRCPWCGEKISAFSHWRHSFARYMNRYWSQESLRCPHCKKPYNSHFLSFRLSVLVSLVLIVFVVFSFVTRSNAYRQLNPFAYAVVTIAIVVLIIVTEIWMLTAPYRRENSDTVPITVLTKIQWHSNGVSIPRFNVLDGEIFPACIFKNGQLIADSWCVALTNLRWETPNTCVCDIHLVLDDAPVEFLTAGNTFVLYHRCKKVAVGRILNSDFLPHIHK